MIKKCFRLSSVGLLLPLLAVVDLRAATFTYSYDSLNRITNAAYSDGSSESYSYDPAGNRLSRITRATTTYFLTLNALQGAVSTNPDQASYYPGSVVSITAVPDTGFRFTGWSGDTNSLENPLTLVMTTNVSVMANFVVIGPGTNSVFADNFDDDIIDTNKWTSSGYTIQEINGYMRVGTDVTDNGGLLISQPVPISSSGDITITRTVFLHYANDNFVGDICMKFGDVSWAAVYYANASYSGVGNMPRYGTFIGRNDVAPDGAHFFLIETGNQQNISQAYPVIWDAWFNEKIIYSPANGILQYLVNGTNVENYNIGIMPETSNPTLQLGFRAWGWNTGHEQLFDDLVVSQTIAPPPIPELSRYGLAPNGIFQFNLNGAVGSNYVIQESTNLIDWINLITNVIPPSGTQKLTFPMQANQPTIFYRAFPLP
jgi:YD repeat-containing protein